MDKELLVAAGHEMVRALDHGSIKPKAALWVYSADTDIWKLWVVPGEKKTDKMEFYREVADAITKNRDRMHGIDISAIEMVPDDSPVIQGMKFFMKMPGLGSASMSNNTVNGVYIPDGVVLRMDV
ncbi:hypothetical protein ACQKKX_03035 [Neorhizobium sp. NPDC001467]|uniref:hypothetical protein n=1 Tax=Neorhizobium sp. NPDC001467 TaxID=3390595 RepID=UPI003D081AFF